MKGRLDVGHVIRRVFEIYVEQASVLMPAAAVVFVLTGIVSALLVAASPALALVALLISLLATTVFTGMIVNLVADIRDGRRDATVGQLLQAVTPVLGQLILVGFVAAIGIVIGLILLVIPGLILITIWSVAAPVVVLERPPGLGALGRSRELVRGNGWWVFLAILLLTILVAIFARLIELAAESAGSGAGLVVTVVLGVLTAPISALAQAVVYFELLDLSASAPAAPPGPGVPAGPSESADAESAFGAREVVEPPAPTPTPEPPAPPPPPEPPRPDIGL
jgi:hypothetical protein